MSNEIVEKTYTIEELLDLLELAQEESNPRKRALRIDSLRQEARKLKATTLFNQEARRLDRVAKGEAKPTLNICSPDFLPEEMENAHIVTGDWFVDDTGIYKDDWRSGNRYYASYVPCFPVERLQNMEEGTERIRLKYYRDYSWNEIVVDKSIISTSNKIVALSDRGLPVDSEKAKYLVQFLSQFEMQNAPYIKRQKSTRKLGWTMDKKHFLPYDSDVKFDGDEFRDLLNSINTKGSAEVWKEEMLRVRKEAPTEVKVMIVASYASVLLSRMNLLPFFVDLWGETEGGKTVTMKAAASIWADPAEGQYIGDFQSTETAIEVKASVLNHLPLMLDDSSKLSKDFLTMDHKGLETFIYAICSGKGKSRSNKSLGINRERTWKLVTLSNGEKPLSGYAKQGGAHNRIIEVECQKDHIFPDPHRSVEVFSRNYGHGGVEFIRLIDNDLIERLSDRRKEIEKQIYDSSVMQKQAISVSFLLAVDELIEKEIFRDGQTIGIEDMKNRMSSRSSVSESAKFYGTLMDFTVSEADKFDETIEYGPFYGRIIDDEEYGKCLDIIVSRLVEICKKEDCSRDQFIKWLIKNDLLFPSDNGNPIRQDRSMRGRARYYRIVIVDDLDEHMERIKHNFGDGWTSTDVTFDLKNGNTELFFD